MNTIYESHQFIKGVCSKLDKTIKVKIAATKESILFSTFVVYFLPVGENLKVGFHITDAPLIFLLYYNTEQRQCYFTRTV
ncbi:hypothetical protein H7F15_18460 [Pontibacter sp. Tf4]|uniref:hypothetical protein n=1 Tax=Pontibacter sp. Tf4 TaxID=2761620 RepID=UPI001626899C|nr:hypothetical protein [Pontibacter sp. Tf4]MBB6613030.1 hypothetical protein [Pontibacter sp. Tf4]